MSFVVQNSGRVESILTFVLVVILPVCVFHCITASSLGLSFLIGLLITIVDLHPIYNKIQKFVKFALLQHVFINPHMIVV